MSKRDREIVSLYIADFFQQFSNGEASMMRARKVAPTDAGILGSWMYYKNAMGALAYMNARLNARYPWYRKFEPKSKAIKE